MWRRKGEASELAACGERGVAVEQLVGSDRHGTSVSARYRLSELVVAPESGMAIDLAAAGPRRRSATRPEAATTRRTASDSAATLLPETARGYAIAFQREIRSQRRKDHSNALRDKLGWDRDLL